MAETLNRIAGIWFEWQWAMLWQTAVLIGVVAVIDRLIRKRAWPQLRYTLWLLVFVKLVLPPGLASPVSVTSQVPALAHQAVQAGTRTPAAPVETHAAASLPTRPAASVAAESPKHAGSTAVALPQAPSAAAQPVQRTSEPLSWAVYAMSIWLVGVVSLGLGLCIRLRRLARDHSASRPAETPEWFDGLLTQTAEEMGLRRVPRVVFSDRVCCPAVFGVLRPILLFPADRLPITRQETRHILLHELAHIKRGDLLVHAGYMILATVYWINPLLWLIRKHVQNLRELCCDATVAAHLREETAGYRETLLATGRALLAQPVDPGLGLLGLFENSGWLPIRLQWLQKKTWRYPWLRRTSVAAVAILMLCCILPMASIDAASENASDQEFKVTLPCGATIELVGIRRAETTQWWRPDGTPLSEAPYDTCSGSIGSQNLYEYAVRYTNLPEGVTGGVRVDPAGCGAGGSIPDGMCEKAGRPVEDIAGPVYEQDSDTKKVNVKIYLSTGDWVTDKTNVIPRRDKWGWYSDGDLNQTLNAIVNYASPYEYEGRVYTDIFCALNDPREQKYDLRLIAVDSNSIEHPPVDRGGGWYASLKNKYALVRSRQEFNVPLASIASFNLQVRSRTWIEFKNASLRPGETQKVEIVTTTPAGSVVVERQNTASKIPATTADEKSANPEFKVALPGGGTIELIGVHKAGTDQWWCPDGSALDEPPYDFRRDIIRTDMYEFALRYQNLPQGARGNMEIEPGGESGPIPPYQEIQKAGKSAENVTYSLVQIAEPPDTVTVKVRLAMGSWNTIARDPHPFGGRGDNLVEFLAAYESEGKSHVTALYPNSIGKDDVRLAALDVNNVEHPPSELLFPSGGPDYRHITPCFDLPLDDIAVFHFQTRPYTWIEFKNVSLRSGKQHKVDVTVTEPDEIVEQKKPADIDKVRNFSRQALKAFHAAFTKYIDENPGKDLPKRPWALKYVSDATTKTWLEGKEIRTGISATQYVHGVGYFRPGGFPSLKREDFESSEAKRTPILYCKMLLEREDGKGTNVLYGDGRVEYVTAAELERLKAAFDDSKGKM
jgi:beta-lactamase regulating signal transducer with metallopeptidase domain